VEVVVVILTEEPLLNSNSNNPKEVDINSLLSNSRVVTVASSNNLVNTASSLKDKLLLLPADGE
jgi:hypothetical protein